MTAPRTDLGVNAPPFNGGTRGIQAFRWELAFALRRISHKPGSSPRVPLIPHPRPKPFISKVEPIVKTWQQQLCSTDGSSKKVGIKLCLQKDLDMEYGNIQIPPALKMSLIIDQSVVLNPAGHLLMGRGHNVEAIWRLSGVM